MRVRGWIACMMMALWLSNCVFRFDADAPPSGMEEAWDDGIYDVSPDPEERYRDGSYTGSRSLPTPQFIVVDVTIKKSRIVAIRLRQHPTWKAPREQEKLLHMVVASQTTSTITPRPEGSEQDQLLDAVDDALNKARQPLPTGR
jgi:uncharacterized protein with FMN-binding domain